MTFRGYSGSTKSIPYTAQRLLAIAMSLATQHPTHLQVQSRNSEIWTRLIVIEITFSYTIATIVETSNSLLLSAPSICPSGAKHQAWSEQKETAPVVHPRHPISCPPFAPTRRLQPTHCTPPLTFPTHSSPCLQSCRVRSVGCLTVAFRVSKLWDTSAFLCRCGCNNWRLCHDSQGFRSKKCKEKGWCERY